MRKARKENSIQVTYIDQLQQFLPLRALIKETFKNDIYFAP